MGWAEGESARRFRSEFRRLQGRSDPGLATPLTSPWPRLAERLQRVLARQLFWNPFGPIVFDAGLEVSVKNFQAANGLTIDGQVGPATWAKLPAYREASQTLAAGWAGPAVGWLQLALAGKETPVRFAPYCSYWQMR